VAINFTVLGLTSLAESKRVLGIEYGKFLLREHYMLVFNKIPFKIKWFLTLFAFINAFAFIGIFMFGNFPVIRAVLIVLLMISFLMLIYYFFSYILYVNNKVKLNIYISAMSCMYTSLNENNRKHAYYDELLNIRDGRPTSKRIFTSVFTFFDKDNQEVQSTFQDIFGTDSFIYKPEKYQKRIKLYAELYNKSTHGKNRILETEINNPYRYRNISESHDIPHEFFQVFRNTVLQERWAIKIYNMMLNTKEGEPRHNIITYSNLVRIVGNTTLFGRHANVRSYKFIDIVIKEYLKHMDKENDLEAQAISHGIDLQEAERLFINDCAHLVFAGIADALEQKTYNVLNEYEKSLKTLINTKTMISAQEKRDVVVSLHGMISEFDKNIARDKMMDGL